MKFSILKSLMTAAIVLASAQANAVTDKDRGIFQLQFELPKPKKNGGNRTGTDSIGTLNCSVNFISVVDGRSNKETLGTNGSKAVRPAGFDVWLNDFKTKMLDNIGEKDVDGAAVIEIQAEVVRLYSFPQAMSIRGVMAMKLTIEQNNKSDTVYVRGYSSKANWANGIAEYGTAATKASHDIVDVIRATLQPRCA